MAEDLLLIPGPITISDAVQNALGSPSISHTSPEFITIFSNALKNIRKIFKAGLSTQPIILSGSGTLGWDIAATNFMLPGDNVLVLSTGFFSDSFAECLSVYGANVTTITAPLGDVVPLKAIEEALQEKKYQMITITHVDTSTAVRTDIKAIADIVKCFSPETFIIVDGVCSVGCENLEFDAWGIDFALTASQKAIGVPAGLSISVASERVINYALARSLTNSFFANLKRWIPIMTSYEAGCAAYFATPPIQLIKALDVSLKEILAQGLDARISKHKETSDLFKTKLKSLGLQLVSINDQVSAHGLTAIYVDDPVGLIKRLKSLGIVVAGGIHKDIKSKYIRVGHMGVSACDSSLNHIDTCFSAIKSII